MLSSGSWFRISYQIDERTVNRVIDQAEAVVGRSVDCDIMLPARTQGVGRIHALFRLTDNGWVIQDNSSRNGTFVNGERIQTSGPLAPGDTIRLGAFAIRFEAVGHSSSRSGILDLGGLVSSNLELEAVDSDNVRICGSRSMNRMSLALERGLSGDDEPDSFQVSPEQRLFHLIGESLASSTNLNDMLARILQTVFECAPVRSGMIALVASSGEVVPRVSRSEGENPVRVSRSIIRKAIADQSALLIEDAQSFSGTSSIGILNIRSAICVPLYNKGTVSGVIYVEGNSLESTLHQEHLEVLSTVALFSAVAIRQAGLREEIHQEQKRRSNLARYFSPSVVDQIIARSDASGDAMLVEERNVSVLFADLKGFTAMSETMSPADVVHLINEIWERMNTVVFRHYGALDKFMGDGMMAFFGAPLAINQHGIAAVRAALEMQAELDRFNMASGRPPVEMRIGINSGPVVMGDIGSKSRKDFTVIGDTVNVASRLESTVAAPGQVIIGPATYEHVSDVFRCQACTPVPLKGKSQTVQPYQVFPQ